MKKKVLIGISGASGAGYSLELIEGLVSSINRDELDITIIYNDISKKILKDETGIEMSSLEKKVDRVIHDSKMESEYASGSNPFDHMIICPCSTSTVGKVHAGISDNLMTRAASVALKEKRNLILVIRETPLSTPTLRAMYKLSAWGVTIMPASPAFYGLENPSVKDIQRNIAGRILDMIEVDNDLAVRYGPEE